jgi:hypothetical protein
MASIEINPEDRLKLYEWHRLWTQETSGGIGTLIEGPTTAADLRTFHKLPDAFLDYLRKKKFWFNRLDEPARITPPRP